MVKKIISKGLLFFMIANLLINAIGIRTWAVGINTPICEVEKISSDQGEIVFNGYVLGNTEEISSTNCKVYVDGVEEWNWNLETKISRPDLKQKFQQYNNAENSGFSYKVDSTKIENGQHRIKFNFAGIEKEVVFNVKNYPKIFMLDNVPSDEEGIINFTGYILGLGEELSFMNCLVYVDGVGQEGTLFSLDTKINRPELKQKYPEYKNAENSGFSYKLDTTTLSNGQHKIKFNFAGIEKEITFNVKNKAKVFEFDNVTSEEGIINFTGYILGLNKDLSLMNCSVYVDGVDQGSTILNLQTQINRPDLKTKYPEYKNAENGGFSYKLDSTTLNNGQHKIKFNFADIEKEITFNVKNKAKVFEFDNVTSEEGIINFTGYILGLNEDLSFVNCSVYVDGVGQEGTLFSLDTKINRPELKQKYPEYKNAENSGFSYKLDTQNIKNGQHKIKFNFQGNEKEILFNVNNKKPILEFESVKENKPGLLEVRGYHFSSFDESQKYCLKVFIDGKLYDSCIYSTNYNIDSKDLLNKYPEYKNHNTNRFAYLVNTTKLANGKHTIKFAWPEIEKSIEINVNNLSNTKVISDEDIMYFNDLKEAEKKIDEAFAKINEALVGINAAIDEINAGLKEANAGIKQMNAAMNQINSAVKESIVAIEQMNKGLKEANAGIDEMNEGVSKINSFMTQTIKIVNDCNTSMDKTIKGVTDARDGINNLLKMKANAGALNEQAVKDQVDKLNKQIEELQQKQQEYNSKWYNQVWEYIKTSGNQVVMGKYTDKVTYLGTFGEFGIGLLGVDLPADLRDLSHDIQYWEFSWSHAGETTLDAIGLFPIVGIIKYGDEARVLVKNGEKYEIKKIAQFEKGASEAEEQLLKGFWNMDEAGSIINGRRYSKHALERMAPNTSEVRAELYKRATNIAKSKGLEPTTKEYSDFVNKYVDPRNIPPMVIEDAVKNTTAIPGNTAGTFLHETESVKVVVNENGDVITVIPK
jgi:prefoldin subunit 5